MTTPTQAMSDPEFNTLVIGTAKGSGLLVLIDSKMLNDNYTNVTGSFPSLVRFARALLAAPAQSGEINQCDGCRVKAPLTERGIHRYSDGSLIGCTANRYAAPAQADSAPIAQPGWKLVPIEPTVSMWVDGFEAVSAFHDTDEYREMAGCKGAAESAKVCWKAMIEATPERQA